jgi:hypothetical protein
MKQRPVAIGLLLCDQVIVEERTKNITPVNCFTRKAVRRFPVEHLPFTVFALLTDGRGDIALDIRVERLDDLEEIYRRSQSHQFAGPLQEFSFIFRCKDCSFPVAGHYDVSLLADGEVIAHRKLTLIQTGNPS